MCPFLGQSDSLLNEGQYSSAWTRIEFYGLHGYNQRNWRHWRPGLRSFSNRDRITRSSEREDRGIPTHSRAFIARNQFAEHTAVECQPNTRKHLHWGMCKQDSRARLDSNTRAKASPMRGWQNRIISCQYDTYCGSLVLHSDLCWVPLPGPSTPTQHSWASESP